MKTAIRHIISVILIILGSISVLAETVSQKEASRIAWNFFNAAAGEVVAKPAFVYNGKNLTTDRLFSPFYVYNHPKMGFVIISAENKAMPVLAYSLNSKFDVSNIPANQQKLLRDYAMDIEYIRYDSRYPTEAFEAWTDIPSFINNFLNEFYHDDNVVRLEDEGTVWVMRKRATEFPGIRDISQEEPATTEDQEDIEEPFSFYDSFIAETASEEEKRIALFEERLHPTKPCLRWIGGGHFEAVIPNGVQLVRIYNMDGAMVRQLKFRNTDTAVFNIDSEPNGFYVALINDNEGKAYGFKFYK